MPFLIGLVTSTVGRYALIAIAAFAGLVWLRYEFRGPLQATIAAMRQAAADKERIAGEDRRRAEANASKAEELQNELDRIVSETKADACRLSPAELDRLRKLSAAK